MCERSRTSDLMRVCERCLNLYSCCCNEWVRRAQIKSKSWNSSENLQKSTLAERCVIARANERASERTNEREADRMEIENKNELRVLVNAYVHVWVRVRACAPMEFGSVNGKERVCACECALFWTSEEGELLRFDVHLDSFSFDSTVLNSSYIFSICRTSIQKHFKANCYISHTIISFSTPFRLEAESETFSGFQLISYSDLFQCE